MSLYFYILHPQSPTQNHTPKTKQTNKKQQQRPPCHLKPSSGRHVSITVGLHRPSDVWPIPSLAPAFFHFPKAPTSSLLRVAVLCACYSLCQKFCSETTIHPLLATRVSAEIFLPQNSVSLVYPSTPAPIQNHIIISSTLFLLLYYLHCIMENSKHTKAA